MYSVLFNNDEKYKEFNDDNIIFKDLNLDDILFEIEEHAKGFDIKPYLKRMLIDESDILYRQDVFKELEDRELFDCLNKFSYTLKKVIVAASENKASKYTTLKYIKLKQNIESYFKIVEELSNELKRFELKSKGLNLFKDYITSYLTSEKVLFIKEDISKINEEMKAVKYCLDFENGTIKIDRYEEKEELLPKVLDVLKSYKPEVNYEFHSDYGKTSEYLIAQMYGTLSKYYFDEFKHLELFYEHFKDFQDEVINRFITEIQVYLSYILVMDEVGKLGLEFNIPSINKDKIYCNDGYDLALAISYIHRHEFIVPNSFLLENKEKIIIVSGPNQGGKTTFSRFFGQTFFLALLGFPVTGTSSSINIVSNICTMYEVEEVASNLNGKLKSELNRIKDIMNNLGDNGLLVMNEVFSSTSLHDGIILGKKVIDMLNEKGAYGLFVTFIDELSNYNDTTVSMGSTVREDNASIRTFEILRRLDNSRSYAISIAKKNHVSYDDIIRRIK